MTRETLFVRVDHSFNRFRYDTPEVARLVRLYSKLQSNFKSVKTRDLKYLHQLELRLSVLRATLLELGYIHKDFLEEQMKPTKF